MSLLSTFVDVTILVIVAAASGFIGYRVGKDDDDFVNKTKKGIKKIVNDILDQKGSD